MRLRVPTAALMPLLVLAISCESPVSDGGRPNVYRPVVSGVESGFDPNTAVAMLTPQDTEILADLGSSTPFQLRIVDANGISPPDGPAPSIASSLGRVQMGSLQQGVANGRFHAGNVPGTTGFTVQGYPSVVEGGGVTLGWGDPWSAQLHLHGSVSEGPGTSAAQVEQARTYGVDLLWWSEHDWGYFGTFQQNDPGFTHGDLNLESVEWPGSWWDREPCEHCSLELGLTDGRTGTALALALDVLEGSRETWATGKARWEVAGSGMHHALLGGVVVTATVVLPDDWAPHNERFRLSALLSEPDTAAGQHRVVIADSHDAVDADELTALVRQDLRPGGNTFQIDLSATAVGAFGSADETLAGVELELGRRGVGRSRVVLERLQVRQTTHGEALRDLQADFLATRYPATNPAQWLGVEVSAGSPHLNVFGDGESMANPADYELPEDAAAIAAAAHAQGAVVSLNHVFGVGNPALDGDTPGAAETCEILDLVDVYGVELLEAGYPERNLPLADHLAVWDCLAARGHLLTGIGTSDQHDAGSWSRTPNNFVTWVIAPALEKPALIEGLRAGRAFFGDPTHFPDGAAALTLSAASGAAMGQVKVPPPATDFVTFTYAPAATGERVRLVFNGAVVAESTAAADGEFRWTAELPIGGEGALRAEVLTPGGAGVLFSNPIYYRAVAVGVPGERLARP